MQRFVKMTTEADSKNIENKDAPNIPFADSRKGESAQEIGGEIEQRCRHELTNKKADYSVVILADFVSSAPSLSERPLSSDNDNPLPSRQTRKETT